MSPQSLSPTDLDLPLSRVQLLILQEEESLLPFQRGIIQMARFVANPRFRTHINREFKRVEREYQRIKLVRLRDAARRNFRNRTFRLWRSIQLQNRRAGIGNRRAFYWQYLDNFTRGTGQFVRTALFDDRINQQDFRQAVRRVFR